MLSLLIKYKLTQTLQRSRISSMTAAKSFLVLLNGFMLLLGASVLTLGIWGMNAGREVSHFVPLGTPTIVMVLGVILLLISLWGIWSAVNEDAVLLRIWLGAMVAVLVAQLIFSSLALARQADIDLVAYDAWDKAYVKDKSALAKFEKTFSCCGFASVYDRAVPSDCADNKEFGFMFPCHDRLAGPLKSTMKTLGTVGIVLAVVQAVGLLVAFMLFTDFDQSYGERDAARMAETRRLLHEGSIPPQQFPTRSS